MCHYFINFIAQIISDLASGSSLKLAFGSFDMSSPFLEHFLDLWTSPKVQARLVLSLLSPEPSGLSKDLWLALVENSV